MVGGQCAELRVEKIENWMFHDVSSMFLQCFFNVSSMLVMLVMHIQNLSKPVILGSFWVSDRFGSLDSGFANISTSRSCGAIDFPATGSKVLWPTEPLGASQSAKSHSECAFAKEQFGHTLCRLKEERNSHMLSSSWDNCKLNILTCVSAAGQFLLCSWLCCAATRWLGIQT